MVTIGVLLLLFFFASAPAFGEDTSPGAQLVQAARRGQTDKVTELLDAGIDVNARGGFNITAVWQAVGQGHDALVTLLVERGADVNVPDSVWHMTPLMLSENAETAALLIRHGAKDVEEALWAAAVQGDLELVQSIVDAKEMAPKALALAKAHAKQGNHEEIVEFLDELNSEPLPDMPSIPAETLTAYEGQYISDRLNDIEFFIRDGQLFVRRVRGGGPDRPLIAIDAQSFAWGAMHFRFQLHGRKVVSVLAETPHSRVEYLPSSEALSVKDGAEARLTTVLQTDDDRVFARERWPSFRGLEARGIAVDQNLPNEWNVEDGTNVQWRTAIPGLGNSSPIVWKDKIFVTTAVGEAGSDDLRIGLYGDIEAVDDESSHSWQLLCLDKDSGRILWQRVAEEGIPPVKRHLKSTHANSTPATDGERVVALFGSGGLYCYDLAGRLLWSRQLGVLNAGMFHDPEYQWGFGSSPIIFRNAVVVQCDLQEGSFIATFDIKTGDQLWKEPRDEIPSWGTPTVYAGHRGPMLFCNGTNFARAYDMVSGREVWRLSGNAAITVPTPIVAYDMVFITSGYRPIQPIFAVQLDAEGDLSNAVDEPSSSKVAWAKERGGPYLQTPLAYQGYLYTCSNNGIFTCYEARTGKQVYRKRAGRGMTSSLTASPVAADGRIYLTAESGDVLVVKAGPDFELLGENDLGEYCLATPAIVGGSFIARTHKHVVAVGK